MIAARTVARKIVPPCTCTPVSRCEAHKDSLSNSEVRASLTALEDRIRSLETQVLLLRSRVAYLENEARV